MKSVIRGAVVVAMFTASCATSAPTRTTTTTAATSSTITLPPAAAETTTSSAVPAASEITLPGGGTLSVPPGAVSAGGRVEASASQSPGDNAAPGLEAVTDPVSLTVEGGTLLTPALLRYPLPIPDVDVAYVAGTWTGDAWAPVWGTYENGVFTAALEHFSVWRVFRWDLRRLAEVAFEKVYSIADTSALTCVAGPLPAGYEIRLDDAGTALSGCAEVNDGHTTIRVKNRRQATMSLELAEGWVASLEGAGDFTAMITNALFNSTGRTFILIPGGETAVIEGDPAIGAATTMPVLQDMFSWALDGLLYAGEVYSLGAKRAGSKDNWSILVRANSERLGEFKNQWECLTASAEFVSAAGEAKAFDQAVAESLIPAIWKCATTVLVDGLKALVSLFTTPLRMLWQLGEFAIDLGTDRRLHVKRTQAVASCDANALADSARAHNVAEGRAAANGLSHIGKHACIDGYALAYHRLNSNPKISDLLIFRDDGGRWTVIFEGSNDDFASILPIATFNRLLADIEKTSDERADI